MNLTVIEEQHLKTLSFPLYKISYAPVTDHLSEVFDPKQLKEYLSLYEKAQKEPAKVQKSVEDWFHQFNHLPELYNLLSYIYVRLKKIRKAEKLIKENYLHNPNNLFARINYADQCLRKRQKDLIPQIFDKTFDLNVLYPSRPYFHFSELIGFKTLMGYYYHSIGEIERAKDYCAYAKMLDPEDPSVRHLTQKLSEKRILSHLLFQLHSKLPFKSLIKK